MKNTTVTYVDSEYDDVIGTGTPLSDRDKAKIEKVLGHPLREAKAVTELYQYHEKRKVSKR